MDNRTFKKIRIACISAVLLLCFLIACPIVLYVVLYVITQVPDLHDAARRGELDRVESLLSQGVDINQRDMYGSTALLLAAGRHDSSIVKFLLEKGADPSVVDLFGYTALSAARYQYDGTPEAAEVILLLERYEENTSDTKEAK